jgi:hypothetical protein
MSGGGVKAPSRCPEKSPKELKAQEGIEWLAGLNPCSLRRIAVRINALEAERNDLAPVRQLAGRRIPPTT